MNDSQIVRERESESEGKIETKFDVLVMTAFVIMWRKVFLLLSALSRRVASPTRGGMLARQAPESSKSPNLRLLEVGTPCPQHWCWS